PSAADDSGMRDGRVRSGFLLMVEWGQLQDRGRRSPTEAGRNSGPPNAKAKPPDVRRPGAPNLNALFLNVPWGLQGVGLARGLLPTRPLTRGEDMVQLRHSTHYSL